MVLPMPNPLITEDLINNYVEVELTILLKLEIGFNTFFFLPHAQLKEGRNPKLDKMPGRTI